MGIRVFIKQKDMLAAGWKRRVETFTYWVRDNEGNDVPMQWPQAVFTKDGVRIVSCEYKNLCVNCEPWEKNRPMFQELGLFDLPYKIA